MSLSSFLPPGLLDRGAGCPRVVSVGVGLLGPAIGHPMLSAVLACAFRLAEARTAELQRVAVVPQLQQLRSDTTTTRITAMALVRIHQLKPQVCLLAKHTAPVIALLVVCGSDLVVVALLPSTVAAASCSSARSGRSRR